MAGETYFIVQAKPSGSGGPFTNLKAAQQHAEMETGRNRESHTILQAIGVVSIGGVEIQMTPLITKPDKKKPANDPPSE